MLLFVVSCWIAFIMMCGAVLRCSVLCCVVLCCVVLSYIVVCCVV